MSDVSASTDTVGPVLVDPAVAVDGDPSAEQGFRQCGRCRRWFDEDQETAGIGRDDWWSCPPCHDALFPNKRSAST